MDLMDLRSYRRAARMVSLSAEVNPQRVDPFVTRILCQYIEDLCDHIEMLKVGTVERSVDEQVDNQKMPFV